MSYQDPYDGLGPQCDPSYNLRAGVAPVDPVVTPTVIGEYVAAGFAVVVPDYEEEQFANDAGQEEGYATLDGVRAAEHPPRCQRSVHPGRVGRLLRRGHGHRIRHRAGP